jgi:hypothetical protein
VNRIYGCCVVSNVFVLVIALLLGASSALRAEQLGLSNDAPDATASESELIARAATAHGLPVAFFARLIWQESRFDPSATSPAGAQGIAQFMPRTARWRGLRDPFEPAEALAASARWLRQLWAEFGNLGLAAAAYNAGPDRVHRWLNGGASLPAETRAYVEIITGTSAAVWGQCRSRDTSDIQTPCSAPMPPAPSRTPVAAHSVPHQGDWGLQLIGDRSQAKALAEYRELQSRFPRVLGHREPLVLARKLRGRGSAVWYQVRVAEASRESATELCTRLKQFGGACLVLRN